MDGDRELLVCNVLPVFPDEIKQNAFLFFGLIYLRLSQLKLWAFYLNVFAPL